MEGVKDASFICGWTRQEDQGYPNRIAWHDSNATPHLFTLWGHFGGHRSLAINRGCVDQTRVSGAELGGAELGQCPAKFALAPEKNHCRFLRRKHIMSVYKATRGAVSHPRALFAAHFFASYFLPEFGGKCWNIFSVSLSKFLMLLLEFPDRSPLADPLHKRLFVFPSKRSTIRVPTW
jgi:hypothetical protein